VPGFGQQNLLVRVVHQLHAAVWSHLTATTRDALYLDAVVHLATARLHQQQADHAHSGDRTCCVHRSSTISAAPFTKSRAHISPSRLHMQVEEVCHMLYQPLCSCRAVKGPDWSHTLLHFSLM
jgi:hypothetical protein